MKISTRIFKSIENVNGPYKMLKLSHFIVDIVKLNVKCDSALATNFTSYRRLV